MPKTCALAATESMGEIKMLGTAPTKKGCFTLWECARLATSLTITR